MRVAYHALCPFGVTAVISNGCRREQEEAAAAAERRSISELRRRSHADGGMSFKVRSHYISAAYTTAVAHYNSTIVLDPV